MDTDDDWEQVSAPSADPEQHSAAEHGADADGWESQPSIDIPAFNGDDQPPSTLQTSDCDEPPSSRMSSSASSPASSVASTPRSTRRSRASVSSADREIITRVVTSNQPPNKFHALDLSAAMKKTRRALKSLRALAAFENLEMLNVANNAVADLGGLEVFTRLEVLILSRNHLKKLQPELWSLSSLKELDLSGNFIAHIPKAIAKLELLEQLNLSGNSLSTLKEVDALSPLTNLHELSFAANPFCKLPAYKDYVVFKLGGVETLDGKPITAIGREKARRRFNDALFAKDARLREVGEAHESEQSRLREAQSALEAENLRLKGELHVKSQLLHNKSRAWSDATEQLLQLQQEIAMLNLERQQYSNDPIMSQSLSYHQDDEIRTQWTARGASRSVGWGGEAEGVGFDSPAKHSDGRARRSFSGGEDWRRQALDNRYAQPSPSPRKTVGLVAFIHGANSPMPSPNRTSTTVTSPISDRAEATPTPSIGSVAAISTPALLSPSQPPPPLPTKVVHITPNQSQAPLPTKVDHITPSLPLTPQPTKADYTTPSLSLSPLSTKDAHTSPILSLSPLPTKAVYTSPSSAVDPTLTQESESNRLNDNRPKTLTLDVRPPSPHRSESFGHVHRAFVAASPVAADRSSCFFQEEIDLADEERPAGKYVRRLSQFPTVEDEQGCPAYEDTSHPSSASSSSSSSQTGQRSPSISALSPQTTPFHRTLSSPGRLVSAPLPVPMSPSRHLWERHHRELCEQLLPATSSNSPVKWGFVDAAAPSDKDVLIHQTRALQSCKQSLLKDIKREEELLHALKLERRQFEMQIENLQVNIQACEDSAKPGDVGWYSSPRTPLSPTRRQGEAVMTKLEVLRSKLRFIEDREKEIELAMVRKTKRVLDTDLPGVGLAFGGQAVSSAAFDQEIFALTGKLQQTIVQKEEVQLEMSRLMAVFREQNQRPPSGHGGRNAATSPRRSIGPTSPAKAPSSEQDPSLAKSYKLLADLRQKHQDVVDRIRVKENLLASLVEELRDVEAELEHIGQVGVAMRTSPTRRRRSISFDGSAAGGPARAFPAPSTNERGVAPTPGKATDSADPSAADISATVKALLPNGLGNGIKLETASAATKSGEAPVSVHFKDMLTAELLDEIKNELFDKLSQQFGSRPRANKATHGHEEQQQLHDAIAAALESHLASARDAYEKKKQAEDEDADMDCSNGRQANDDDTQHQSAAADDDADAHCSRFTEVSHSDAVYESRYRFVKTHAASASFDGSKSVASGTQRLLKACERLEAARSESRVHPTTFMEMDPTGCSKSSLKVLLMSARDLPTSHLRTKNLDPYVVLEIVYPELKRGGSGASSGSSMVFPSFRSRTMKQSVYPVWDEEFAFSPVLALNGFLRVRVLNDRKLSREQLVGEAKIPLRTLLHQRRAVEWFSLEMPAPSPVSRARKPATSKVISKICGGSIRLQLQLSYSRIDKCRRVVDELVTRYLHDHNHLPPFIEAVDASFDTAQERPEQDEPDVTFPTLEPPDLRQTQQREADFPLSELENSLAAYGRWRSNSADGSATGPSSPHAMVKELSQLVGADDLKVLSTSDIYAGVVNSPPAVNSLRSTCPTVSTNATMATPDVRHEHNRHRVSSSMGRSHARAETEARGRMTQTMPSPSATRMTPTIQHGATTRRHKTAGRDPRMSRRPLRQKPSPSRPDDPPECFDEYSQYHPGFHYVDALGGGNDAFTSKRRRASPTFEATRHFSDRKTDLRIFKSPGFSRRQPASGFPERYIGLDNQTCERLKRMFGRIDATEAPAPRPSR